MKIQWLQLLLFDCPAVFPRKLVQKFLLSSHMLDHIASSSGITIICVTTVKCVKLCKDCYNSSISGEDRQDFVILSKTKGRKKCVCACQNDGKVKVFVFKQLLVLVEMKQIRKAEKHRRTFPTQTHTYRHTLIHTHEYLRILLKQQPCGLSSLGALWVAAL